MTKRKELYKPASHLTVSEQIRIRFNETDPLGIVWHGYYITYFEDGREAFGRKHGISYLDIHNSGYTTPIVKSSCEHKQMVKYGDIIRIETSFIDTPAAKMIFHYNIFDQHDRLACTGETVQVFMDSDGSLSLNIPPFFEQWKRTVGLLQ